VRGNAAEIPVSAVPGKSSVKNAAHAASAAATGANDARKEDRTVHLEGGQSQFPLTEKGKQPSWSTSTNCVITSKYTLITFLPINLFEQFSNLANLYFLLVSHAFHHHPHNASDCARKGSTLCVGQLDRVSGTACRARVCQLLLC
jgi:hypothetical protein